MNIRVFRIDNKRTNELLERIAVALEKLHPEPIDTEITDFVVDEVLDSPSQRDESEGLDEIRKSGTF